MTERHMFIRCDAPELVRQIGRRNVLAISGGRVIGRSTGITLPAGCGYSVTVDLAAGDTYVVRRVFGRAGKQWIKGERAGVSCDEVGEAAYYASCFRSYDENQWPVVRAPRSGGAASTRAKTWESGPDAYRHTPGGRSW